MWSLLVTSHLSPKEILFSLSSESFFSFFIMLVNALFVKLDMQSMNFTDQTSSYLVLYFVDFKEICLKDCRFFTSVLDFDSSINAIDFVIFIDSQTWDVVWIQFRSYLLLIKVNYNYLKNKSVYEGAHFRKANYLFRIFLLLGNILQKILSYLICLNR